MSNARLYREQNTSRWGNRQIIVGNCPPTAHSWGKHFSTWWPWWRHIRFKLRQMRLKIHIFLSMVRNLLTFLIFTLPANFVNYLWVNSHLWFMSNKVFSWLINRESIIWAKFRPGSFHLEKTFFRNAVHLSRSGVELRYRYMSVLRWGWYNSQHDCREWHRGSRI